MYKFSKCKQSEHSLTCSINNEDLYFAIELEKPYLSISIFGLQQKYMHGNWGRRYQPQLSVQPSEDSNHQANA